MNIFSIYLNSHNNQTKKARTKKQKQNKTKQKQKQKKHGNEKSFLVIASNLKGSIYKYINTVCTKSASKDSSNWCAIFGSSACKVSMSSAAKDLGGAQEAHANSKFWAAELFFCNF